MSRTNRNLLILAAALFALSVVSFRQSVDRADRFQRGQLFLPNMNPDEVAVIEIDKGEERVTLRRQGDRFRVASKQGYPASNAAVNRFLRDLLEISLEREVGRSDELASELAIEPPAEETLEVALRDRADKDMVRLRVGKSFADGPGNYVRRLDVEEAPIYLTSKAVFLSSDAASFLEKEILDYPGSRVLRVRGPDFTLERAADEGAEKLELTDLRSGQKAKSSEIDRLQSILAGLRFDDVHVADDPQVRDLEFEEALRVDLDDGSGYDLSYASRDDRHFLRLRGFHQVQQVAISRDEPEEELKQKAELLTRADEIDAFNELHGSWVYEISDWTAEKLRLRRGDLIESESD